MHDVSETTPPLVTVCIPTIGRMQYLTRVFERLPEQTYPNVEVIILDNGSPLDAQLVIDAFAASHPNVHVLRSAVRVPMFVNFNRGVQAARGKYTAFFHDDDEYDPAFLARLVALMEAHPSAAFAGGNFDIMDGEGQLTRRRKLIPRTELWKGRRFIEEVMRRGLSPLSTPAILFRSDLLKVHGFDVALPMNWGDFPILMRLAERGDVAVHEDPLFRWRVHGANSSNIPSSDAVPLRTRLLLDYCDEFAARHPAETRFTATIRAHAARTHLKGLLWGWISAGTEDDALRCRQLLAGTGAGRWLSSLLNTLEVAGLSGSRRIALVGPLRSLTQRVLAWRGLLRTGA